MSIHPEDRRRERERNDRTPSQHRIQELLEANNRYLERARVAEAKLATLEADKTTLSYTLPLMPSPSWPPYIQRFGRGLRGNAETVVAEQRIVFNDIRSKFAAAGIRDDGVHILGLVDKAVAMVEALSAQRDKDTPALMNAERDAIRANGDLQEIRSMLNACFFHDADTPTGELVADALKELTKTRAELKEAISARDSNFQRISFLEDRLTAVGKAIDAEMNKADIIPF
jgi:hypothetical protein